VFFTGLSGSGKSTTAEALEIQLRGRTARPITVLDGDVVRRTLWPDLGFSKADRDTNIRRLGRLAADVTKSGGVAVCASIAPYVRLRQEVRDLVTPLGGFVLVHMATPLEVCEQRDPKGLYARARAGFLQEFTGISDPYEVPDDAEIVLDATHGTAEDGARMIVRYLATRGYLEALDGPPR
jgi:sulfate adenylyltransferase